MLVKHLDFQYHILLINKIVFYVTFFSPLFVVLPYFYCHRKRKGLLHLGIQAVQ